MKKGFNNSIGWNRGNIFGSIHLFEPLTSTPIKGTKTKKIKKIINKIKQIFNSLFFSKKEKMINIVNANKVIIRCLTKK